jgi:hypothetical protein
MIIGPSGLILTQKHHKIRMIFSKFSKISNEKKKNNNNFAEKSPKIKIKKEVLEGLERSIL